MQFFSLLLLLLLPLLLLLVVFKSYLFFHLIVLFKCRNLWPGANHLIDIQICEIHYTCMCVCACLHVHVVVLNCNNVISSAVSVESGRGHFWICSSAIRVEITAWWQRHDDVVTSQVDVDAVCVCPLAKKNVFILCFPYDPFWLWQTVQIREWHYSFKLLTVSTYSRCAVPCRAMPCLAAPCYTVFGCLFLCFILYSLWYLMSIFS